MVFEIILSLSLYSIQRVIKTIRIIHLCAFQEFQHELTQILEAK